MEFETVFIYYLNFVTIKKITTLFSLTSSARTFSCDLKLPCVPFFYCRRGDVTVWTIQGTNFTELEGFVLQSLEELVVERELCSTDGLWAFLKLMPNLTRLGIGLDNDGFRIVCRNLKGLTALDMKPSRVDQYGITGKVVGLDVQLPNITDLENLHFFGIGKALTSAAVLSEDVVKNGLLQLSSLHDISVYCSRDMSEETFTQIRQKYPKSYIHRSDIE